MDPALTVTLSGHENAARHNCGASYTCSAQLSHVIRVIGTPSSRRIANNVFCCLNLFRFNVLVSFSTPVIAMLRVV